MEGSDLSEGYINTVKFLQIEDILRLCEESPPPAWCSDNDVWSFLIERDYGSLSDEFTPDSGVPLSSKELYLREYNSQRLTTNEFGFYGYWSGVNRKLRFVELPAEKLDITDVPSGLPHARSTHTYTCKTLSARKATRWYVRLGLPWEYNINVIATRSPPVNREELVTELSWLNTDFSVLSDNDLQRIWIFYRLPRNQRCAIFAQILTDYDLIYQM